MKQEWQAPILEELDAKQTAFDGPSPGGDGFSLSDGS